jgi:hypothetical protein
MAETDAGAPPPDHPMPPQDRDFWIAVGLWGAALVTVLGCGLYAFIEQSYWYGAGFTSVGLAGLMYLTLHLKGRRLTPRVGAMATMLAVTWALIAYQIWYVPNGNGELAAAQKSTLIDWLKKAQQERDQALQVAVTMQAQIREYAAKLTDLQTQLETAAQPLYPRNMGPITVLNQIWAADDLWKNLIPGTAILMTSDDPENELLRRNLQNIISMRVMPNETGPVRKILSPPDYQHDIDAPKLPESDMNGIIIHGVEQVSDGTDKYMNDRFENIFSCFFVRFTRTTVEGLSTFYKVPKILWIEIGKGSPWRAPRGMERWTCQD